MFDHETRNNVASKIMPKAIRTRICQASRTRKAKGMNLQLSGHDPVIKFLNACRKKIVRYIEFEDA
jgi:hypothetical protein